MKNVFSRISWWFHFIITVIMNSIVVMLLLIGALLLFYYVDVVHSMQVGQSHQPLFQAYVIISQSMEPTIHVQDAIVIKREDDYKIGDVCTYISKNPSYLGILITHRIIGITKDINGNTLYTFKGDNNYSADPIPVEKDQIYGKVVMKVPKVGFIQYFLSNAYGWIIAVVTPCIGIITIDIMKLIRIKKLKRKKRNGAINEE